MITAARRVVMTCRAVGSGTRSPHGRCSGKRVDRSTGRAGHRRSDTQPPPSGAPKTICVSWSNLSVESIASRHHMIDMPLSIIHTGMPPASPPPYRLRPGAPPSGVRPVPLRPRRGGGSAPLVRAPCLLIPRLLVAAPRRPAAADDQKNQPHAKKVQERNAEKTPASARDRKAFMSPPSSSSSGPQ